MSNPKGPACKKCRRSGEKLFLKGERCYTAKCAIEKRDYPPGIRNLKRRVSEFGIRLREKQKLRHFYGVTERKMRNYFKSAVNQKGVTGQNLLQLFERRLDNVVFKSGITKSRKEARQLVRHNHFVLNGKKANIPSILVKEGDVIQIAKPASEFFKTRVLLLKDHEFPAWIEYNSAAHDLKVAHLPKQDEIASPVNMQLIVEYYSR